MFLSLHAEIHRKEHSIVLEAPRLHAINQKKR